MENTFDFVAIDFETPFPPYAKPNYICQVGLVAVKNGIIVEKFSSLVQPPNNVYDKNTSNFHGITPEMTVNTPTWDQLWAQIRHFFEGQKLVAHNSKFETDILNFTSDYYGIMLMGINPIFCTCNAFSQTSFEILSYGFGMSYDPKKHHDALYDAEGCAQFYLNYLSGISPDWRIIEEKKQKKTKRTKRSNEHEYNGRQTLSGDFLIKDLTGADPDNPFYDRKVVITGTFEQDRRRIGAFLKDMGADIDSNITKNIHFVFIGNDPGPKKIEKINQLIHDGFNIRKLDQVDLNFILAGEWDNYYIDRDIKKDLDFMMDHYDKHHLVFEDNRNIISSKDLFVGDGLSGDRVLFNIILGNLGACIDERIYTNTNICIISDSTLDKLNEKEKDQTILYIQEFYNNNKSQKFIFKFLSESEILNFCKRRCEQCGDELTMGYYERYIESGIKNKE